jgi:hypothetical protein
MFFWTVAIGENHRAGEGTTIAISKTGSKKIVFEVLFVVNGKCTEITQV